MKKILLVCVTFAFFFFPFIQKEAEEKIAFYFFLGVSKIEEKIISLKQGAKPFVVGVQVFEPSQVEIMIVKNNEEESLASETKLQAIREPDEAIENVIQPFTVIETVPAKPDGTNTARSATLNIGGAIIPIVEEETPETREAVEENLDNESEDNGRNR